MKSQQLCVFGLPEIPVCDSRKKKEKHAVQHVQASSQLTIIPCLSVHPGQINIYSETHWEPLKSKKVNEADMPDNQKRKYAHLLDSKRSAQGFVSVQAERKIKKALDYLLYTAKDKKVENSFSGKSFKFKIAFVTLTLPSAQIHTDNEIKERCLNSLLLELTKKYKVKNYIWRAEKQENGNIHFHLIVDKFIPYQELRDRWNRIVNKLGYVDRYRELQENWHQGGFKLRKELLKTWPAWKQFQAYQRGAKTHWNSPNSTDIHSVQRIHNLKLYIVKYMTKKPKEQQKLRETEEKLKENLGEIIEENKENLRELFEEIKKETIENQDKTVQVQGRIWSCNQELSNLKGGQLVIDSEIEKELERVISYEGVRVLKENYYSIIFISAERLLELGAERLFLVFSKFLLDRFGYSTQLSLTG
jgi:hypothetical protein